MRKDKITIGYKFFISRPIDLPPYSFPHWVFYTIKTYTDTSTNKVYQHTSAFMELKSQTGHTSDEKNDTSNLFYTYALAGHNVVPCREAIKVLETIMDLNFYEKGMVRRLQKVLKKMKIQRYEVIGENGGMLIPWKFRKYGKQYVELFKTEQKISLKKLKNI